MTSGYNSGRIDLFRKDWNFCRLVIVGWDEGAPWWIGLPHLTWQLLVHSRKQVSEFWREQVTVKWLGLGGLWLRVVQSISCKTSSSRRSFRPQDQEEMSRNLIVNECSFFFRLKLIGERLNEREEEKDEGMKGENIISIRTDLDQKKISSLFIICCMDSSGILVFISCSFVKSLSLSLSLSSPHSPHALDSTRRIWWFCFGLPSSLTFRTLLFLCPCLLFASVFSCIISLLSRSSKLE